MHKRKTVWASVFAVLTLMGILYSADDSVQDGVRANSLPGGPVLVEAMPLNAGSEHIFPDTVTFVAGWRLESDHPDFGGWSGMVMQEHGKKLLAISDKGIWMQADMDMSSTLTPLSNVELFPYNHPAAGDKEALDAESLIKVEGGYVVSFEGKHRLEFVPNNYTEVEPVLLNTGVDYTSMASNKGMEAIARMQDGSMVLFAENGRDVAGSLAAWWTKDGEEKAFRLQPPRNFAPTDAAVLPCGDILLLMRRYSAIEGVFAKLVQVSSKDLSADMVVADNEVLNLAKPFPVDNMEAMDVVVQQDGTVRIFMLSDDNFNAFQDTVLLVFDWKPLNFCS